MAGIKEITAKEGYYLTQAAEVGESRIFITALKGASINESDWRLATAEEKLAFEEAQQENTQEQSMDYDSTMTKTTIS